MESKKVLFYDVPAALKDDFITATADKTSSYYDSVGFLKDGSGIIAKGQLYINSSYYIAMADTWADAQAKSIQNKNTIYFVPKSETE